MTTHQDYLTTLTSVKTGDIVAQYCWRGTLQRQQVSRCTTTQITVGNQKYTRKGIAVGEGSSRYFDWIEVWDEKRHPIEIEHRRAKNRLNNSRAKLANFQWAWVTQIQADAVLSAMLATGMLETV